LAARWRIIKKSGGREGLLVLFDKGEYKVSGWRAPRRALTQLAFIKFAQATFNELQHI
jgi:hypothetical protein